MASNKRYMGRKVLHMRVEIDVPPGFEAMDTEGGGDDDDLASRLVPAAKTAMEALEIIKNEDSTKHCVICLEEQLIGSEAPVYKVDFLGRATTRPKEGTEKSLNFVGNAFWNFKNRQFKLRSPLDWRVVEDQDTHRQGSRFAKNKTGCLMNDSLQDINPKDSTPDIKNDSTYFGNIAGRVANRITGTQFTLDGTVYKLVPNEGKNMLHGRPKGFSEVIWKVYSYNKNSHITFTYDSFDGEEDLDFGNTREEARIRWLRPNEIQAILSQKYERAFEKYESQEPMFRLELGENGTTFLGLVVTTPVNLALHTYWNLGGQSSGNILAHTIQLIGSQIAPVDNDLLPTRKVTLVKGTPYGFLEPCEIGSKFNELPDGYDINHVLEDLNPGHLKKAGVVKENVSRRKLELWTNKPWLQFYTSNKLDNVKGENGFVYKKHAGICLETQVFPYLVNHPKFPSQIVNPRETYKHIMIYRFTTDWLTSQVLEFLFKK
ncbi:hypothetical protein GH714_040773 [Hevea brasiliensis]|uniref:Aldose 1-epimerase n=1 Tax=Hevea brasiliensis TaxID=3981 RepID=A0A6A6MU69_HEVBR|nr:hypothetical protein GH714_040773 [Hevea brasiliensis]